MQIPLVDLKAQYQALKGEINSELKKIFSSGVFVKGPILEQFEKDFANFIGTKYCIGVASGTDALHLSLLALGIGKDNEVILPVNTFVATAYAILYVRAKPVFVDVDSQTFNIDVNKIENRITKHTKAIIPVHLYGQPAEMDKILSIAKKYKLAVVEDACQTHGALFLDKNVGTFGDLACFSFYPSKNLGAYGDGGAITTQSIKFTNLIKKLREYGTTSKYTYDLIGINSRLDPIQAAILQIKLKYLKQWNQKKIKLAQYYNQKLKSLKFVKTPFVDGKSTHVYHLYVIQTPRRDELAKFLASVGIQTGIHYPLPLHLQKSLLFLGYKKGDFPIAERLSNEILSLPMYPELTSYQQNYIIESIKKFFKV